MKKKQTQEPAEQKMVSFRRLVYESLPEMWGFQILMTLVLAIPATLLSKLISSVAGSSGSAVTTANLSEFLLSWRSPVILVLAVVLVLCFVVAELFSQIYMTDDILSGRTAGIRREVSQGVRCLRRFRSSAGVGVLVFIFIAVPLCGVGFSISLTRYFKIPNFIMDVVMARPYYAIPYIILILWLIWTAYRNCFVLHAVLLDGMSVKEARALSTRVTKTHGRQFVLGLIKLGVVLGLILLAAVIVFGVLPRLLLEHLGASLPHDQVINVLEMAGDPTDLELDIMGYRITSAFTVLLGSYLITVVTLLCGAYFMLRYTRYYREYTREETVELWPERPKKALYRRKVLLVVVITVLVAVLSLVIGVFYNQIFDREEPVRIVAHRTGGTMASENSIEGLYKAIEHGCYASETDTQRTKDGYYIINHDNDFKRLTGVAEAPQDMTLAEVMELRIQDTTGSGEELTVPMLEDMLDVVKGKEKLFIELKGATADRQMVDDVVRMVREKDCVDDVALISLGYDIIDYAESTYPEFETGVLFFGGLGNVANLNCDLLIMEEEMGTEERIDQIHDAGKQAIVWTVNTEDSMYRFLQSGCDAVITDEIELAEKVQAELDARTEYEVLRDKLADFWSKRKLYQRIDIENEIRPGNPA